LIWVSPAGEYGLDEPNTGPFCLMRTQPWAHALDVGRRSATATSAATDRTRFVTTMATI
jgi:hypothetical protein